jgi:hypothetical protein
MSKIAATLVQFITGDNGGKMVFSFPPAPQHKSHDTNRGFFRFRHRNKQLSVARLHKFIGNDYP